MPYLPLGNGATAHVYISSEGASALTNHTDVTEILVVQLLGRKEWLHCREKPSGALPFVASGKLDKCTTYGADEMAALECERLTTAPGDELFLPRRTVHSARAVRGGYSVHPDAPAWRSEGGAQRRPGRFGRRHGWRDATAAMQPSRRPFGGDAAAVVQPAHR